MPATDEAPNQAETYDSAYDVARPDVDRQEVVFREIRCEKRYHQGPVSDSNNGVPDFYAVFGNSHVPSQMLSKATILTSNDPDTIRHMTYVPVFHQKGSFYVG